MADRKIEDIPRAVFLSAIFVPFSFLNPRTAQSFNSTSGKSKSHKRTSLQQILLLRGWRQQENKALSGVTSVARILFI
jgi:hypothetical protein